MPVKRLFLALGILCVMVAISADLQLTRQQAEVLGGDAVFGVAAPPEAEVPVDGIRIKPLAPHFYVVILATAGWVTIAGSLALILVEVFGAASRHRYRR